MDGEVFPPDRDKPDLRAQRGSHPTTPQLLAPWQPGQSGNPHGIGLGKRHESDYQQTMRIAKQNSPAAMMTLVMVMNTSKDDRVRVVAANSILDRAGMKPPKDKEGTHDAPKFNLDSMNPAELSKLREFFGDLAAKAESNQRAGLGPDNDSESGVTDINPETGEVI